jgi:hypothetical protein
MRKVANPSIQIKGIKMKNNILATIEVKGEQVHSLDSTLDKAEFLNLSQKVITDRTFGTLGEQKTVVPAIQTVTIQGTEANKIAPTVEDARTNETTKAIAGLEILSISTSSIKLVKGV